MLMLCKLFHQLMVRNLVGRISERIAIPPSYPFTRSFVVCNVDGGQEELTQVLPLLRPVNWNWADDDNIFCSWGVRQLLFY